VINYEVCSREDFEKAFRCVEYILYPVWTTILKSMKFD